MLAAVLLSSPQTPSEPPRFKVAVDAVTFDAVVTDRDGHVVPDLTAEDFEIFQDGKRQKVAFAQFVPVLTAAAVSTTSPAASLAEPATHAPSVTSAPVKRESVRRTLVVLVDDLGLSVEGLFGARRALHAFVDEHLLPGDLVAILRTGASAGTLQTFTIDRRMLHAAIDALRWNGHSRNEVEPYEPVNISEAFDDHATFSASDFTTVNALRNSMSAAGTLGALNLAIQGTRDLPGRKAVILVSEGFHLTSRIEAGPPRPGASEQANDNPELPETRVRYALDRVIDQATRAGVVIYSLDSRGLQTAGLQASDNIKSQKPLAGTDAMADLVRRQAADRVEFNRDTQEGLAYVAEQTGGFAVMNTNDLVRGLGRISEDVRDYYVIGYVPQSSTFALNGKTPRLHKITVNVRRPGLRVKTRKEFLGVSDPQQPAAPVTPAQQLVHAATSPFAPTDIVLHATNLPGYSPERGMFVRTLLHIDARALTFVDRDGKKTASADVVGLVFNGDGVERAQLSTGFEVALTQEAATEALRDGLVYTLRVPIRSPGGYQVRFAVRDRTSGALGSAGEFLDIPDIAGGAFALSGLVLRTGDDAVVSPSVGSDQFVVTPAQALRVYSPGTRLSYAYEIYNAGPSVQAAPSLWHGTEKLTSLPADTLVPPAGAARRFAAAGGLKLGDELPPGSYVLQVSATTPDIKHAGRVRAAVQRIAFELR